MDAPKEHNQQTKQPDNWAAALTGNRKLRLAALPLLIIATALTITFAVQTKDRPASNIDGSSSVNSSQATQDDGQGNESARDSMQRQEEDRLKTKETIRDDGDGSTTEVTVNGESITVPENGSYHKSTDDGSTKTDIDVDNSNHSSTSGNSSSNSSSSRIKVEVQSNSSSESP